MTEKLDKLTKRIDYYIEGEQNVDEAFNPVMGNRKKTAKNFSPRTVGGGLPRKIGAGAANDPYRENARQLATHYVAVKQASENARSALETLADQLMDLGQTAHGVAITKMSKDILKIAEIVKKKYAL